MINNNFIYIIIEDKNISNDIYNFLNNKYNLSIKRFHSITELERSCLNSLSIIITNLDINKFLEFIGIKIIKFNKEIDESFIKKIDLELEYIKKIKTTLKKVLKENTLKLELLSNRFNIENLDNFIFYMLNKLLLNMSVEFKYSIITILKESISNAFYHGNFEIDSRIKSETDGFKKFYDLISQKQDDEKYNLRRVNINIKLKPEKVIVSIKDEGNGFNYKQSDNLEKDSYGRGIKLIKINSDSINWNTKGNEIIIEKKING